MIPELAPAFAGPLRFATDSAVLGPDGRRALPVAELLRPGVLAGLAATFEQRYPKGDAGAVLSMWSQFYMSVLVYPAFSVALRLRRALPLAPAEVSLVLAEDGAPAALQVAHAGEPLAHGISAAAHLGDLVRRHVEPVIQALAAAGRVSARVFWCNAGVRMGHVLRLLSTEPGSDAATHRLLHQSEWEDGWDNPLVRSFHPTACSSQPAPQRRVCCLRYRLPGLEQGCGTCPLPQIRGRHLA